MNYDTVVHVWRLCDLDLPLVPIAAACCCCVVGGAMVMVMVISLLRYFVIAGLQKPVDVLLLFVPHSSGLRIAIPLGCPHLRDGRTECNTGQLQ